MFGFGLGKLLVLVILVVGVWYGFKLVGRRERERKRQVREDRKQAKDSVGEMEKCPVCETYVVSSGPGNCGRADCPY